MKTAGERKKQYEYESSPGFKRENSESKRENFNLVGERRHDCRTSKECNQDWDKLGCIELYKLEKVDDRIELMKSVSCCFSRTVNASFFVLLSFKGHNLSFCPLKDGIQNDFVRIFCNLITNKKPDLYLTKKTSVILVIM